MFRNTFPIILLLLLTACASTKQDPFWIVGDNQTITKTNEIVITSDPPGASVAIDGVSVSHTDYDYHATHSAERIVQYQRTMKGRTELERKTRTQDVDIPRIVNISISKDGFYTETRPVHIPSSSSKLHFNLQPIGTEEHIKCNFFVEARPEYLTDIQHLIEKYAKSKVVIAEFEIDNTVDIVGREYEFVVDTTTTFDELVVFLKQLAKTKDFVFNILDAQFAATFSTNDLGAHVTITVSGRVRNDSRLYLVQAGGQELTPVPTKRGRFSVSVQLPVGTRYVHMLSSYQDGKLNVYKRIHVFDNTEAELTEEEFTQESGVTPKQIEALKLVKEPAPESVNHDEPTLVESIKELFDESE